MAFVWVIFSQIFSEIPIIAAERSVEKKIILPTALELKSETPIAFITKAELGPLQKQVSFMSSSFFISSLRHSDRAARVPMGKPQSAPMTNAPEDDRFIPKSLENAG